MSLKFSLIFALCLAAFAISNSERVRYDYYRVYKVTASNEKELKVLKEMENLSDSLIFLEGVHLVDKSIQVIVAPHKLPDFLQALGDNEIDYEIISENLQAIFDDEDNSQIRSIQGRATDYGWEAYYELDDTYTWLASLPASYPGRVTLIEAGKSYEKRSILGVKIHTSEKNKPGIFWEAGIHAREWISPATTTYLINQLLTSEDEAIKNLAENYDWYIFPHTNPDGYVYTHTTNRLWRKTRQPSSDSCFGTDPNRNWDAAWNTIGTSDNPCSDTYAGTKAFSEIETKSLSNYIKSLEGKIQLYLSFHSYSQYVLYPFGSTNELPDNVEDFRRVFDVTVDAIGKRYGTTYTGGNIYDAIYPASGSSVDWAYSNVNTRMAFCIELRPGPNSIIFGFRLPASQIIPTGEETLDGVVAMVNEIKGLGYFNATTN